jgi:hypothetical protein
MRSDAACASVDLPHFPKFRDKPARHPEVAPDFVVRHPEIRKLFQTPFRRWPQNEKEFLQFGAGLRVWCRDTRQDAEFTGCELRTDCVIGATFSHFVFLTSQMTKCERE